MVARARILFWLIPVALSIGAHRPALKPFYIKGAAQGTDYSITYYASDSVIRHSSVDSILQVIDQSMSLYKPGSLIRRWNSGHEDMEVDAHFATVLRRSFTINRKTDGLFDITVGGLVDAWGFGANRQTGLPDSTRIAALLACTGMQHIKLSGNRLRKRKPCVQLDVNGIAQGYTVDVLAGHLERYGIKTYMVELGGELRVKGVKPDGTPFRIGVEGPASSAGNQPVIRRIVSLRSGAITTSGNYRKFVEQDNKRYSHLINPETGYPIDTDLVSVTVFARDAVTADGYDNALMGMGMQQAIRFVNKFRGMEAYMIFVDSSGAVTDTMTAGFRKMIVN